jgi:hypothetical protein
VDEAIDEGRELFAGAGKDEALARVPVEFEAGGEGGDPDLADRRVRRDNELGGRVVEYDVQDAVLLFDFEAAVLFGIDQALLERFDGVIGVPAKSEFIQHQSSVATGREERRSQPGSDLDAAS